MADKKVPKGRRDVSRWATLVFQGAPEPSVRLDAPSLEGEVHLGLDDLGPRRVLPGS